MTNIDRHILVIRSITGAMSGQKLLEHSGITASVQRNTATVGKQGCGYALRVSGDVGAALRILESAGITVTEIQGG